MSFRVAILPTKKTGCSLGGKMAGPWEKYKTEDKAPEAPRTPKPWERYQAPSSEAPATEVSFAERGVETLKALGRGIVSVGRKVDSVTGAPIRAAIGAVQGGENPLKAYGSQFGEDPELAPTGKEIAAKAGLSSEEYLPTPFVGLDGKNFKVSPAGVTGFGIDVLADPTNVIPTSALIKGSSKLGMKAAGEAAALGIRGAAATADVATGTKIGTKALNFAKEQKEAAKLAMADLFNPKQADDFIEMARVAEKNGIPVAILPESVEFGHNSVVTRASRVKAEGPLGQAELEKFHRGLEQTKKATQSKAASIAGGRILTPQEAGDLIREGYDQAVTRLMTSSSDTYRSISSKHPGLLINSAEAEKFGGKLSELGRFADSRVKMGMTSSQKSQARQLQESVDSLKSTFSDGWEQGAKGELVGQPLFDDMVQRLQILGEAAFKKRGGLDLDPPDVVRLRGLYGDMRESIIGTIEKDLKNGDKIADALRANNAKITEFLDERGPLERALGNKNLADEGVYRQLVENGDTAKIEALSNILTPEQMQQLKGTFLNDILRPDFEDNFTFGRAKNAIKAKEMVFQSLLSPEEIKEFTDLVRLGDRFGQPIMSTSGTGASFGFKNIKDGVTNALISDSFIKSLKDRARKGSPQVMQRSTGFPEQNLKGSPQVMQTSTGVPGQNLKGSPQVMQTSTGVPGQNLNGRDFGRKTWDNRLKGGQVLSVQPTEENDKRREAMRRRQSK